MEIFKKSVAVLVSLILSMTFSFSSFADFTDRLDFYKEYLASDSNAIMSVSNDADSGIMPMSSVGTVTNTIKVNQLPFSVDVCDSDGNWYQTVNTVATLGSDNRYHFSYLMGTAFPSNYYISDIMFGFDNGLPSPAGNYSIGFDFTSATGLSYRSKTMTLRSRYAYTNSTIRTVSVDSDIFRTSSGDIYASWNSISIRSSYSTIFLFVYLDATQVRCREVGGSFAINFTPVSSAGAATAGPTVSQEDYNSDVSSSLTDISSSVGEMSSNIDSMASDMAQAAAELQYISNSQQLIIQGIDNVILHISDQLYAFWDQLYNLIHLPEMDMMGQILQAIKDINLDITIDFGELKQAINSMSSAIQDKIQGQMTNDNKIHQEQISNDNKIADEIVNGYDDSSLNSANDQLKNALQENAAAEEQIVDQISEPLESFTFENPVTQYLSTFLLFGNFLQDLFASSGAFKDVINLSFLMGIALMVAGLYRFKGGN